MPNFSALRRQMDQMRSDPVLRGWIWHRLLKGLPVRPPELAQNPPYLNGVGHTFKGDISFSNMALSADTPTRPIEIPLPGETISLRPDDAHSFYARAFRDTEAMLAAHRFAWLPLLGTSVDPNWVRLLWQSWTENIGDERTGWPWHPYTTAERAINILSFARFHGLPGDGASTLELLRQHCAVIADNLEYFGEAQTGNHLANNGRGLFLSGLALGLDDAAILGAKILLQEAQRIFSPSGVLREGSSHYHLLLTRAYLECWLAAYQYQRPETDDLKRIVVKALAVIPHLCLPAGFPLIGDVSPDCPPAYLLALLSGERKDWSGHIGAEATSQIAEILAERQPVTTESLAEDGWVRGDHGPWSGLWYFAPGGWAPSPGHGHQDFGSFELDHDNDRLFCDLGRRSYGPSGDQDVSIGSHNTITVDGQAPFPLNRAYYDEAYRTRTARRPPQPKWDGDGVEVKHFGFSRLSGLGAHRRHWRFDGAKLHLSDELEGSGRHEIIRRFHTTLPVRQTDDGLMIGRYRLSADGQVDVQSTKRWPEYGTSEPATVISITSSPRLPWQSVVSVEPQ